MYVYMCMYALYVCECALMYKWMSTYIYIYIYINIYIYIHMYMHIYIYMCVHVGIYFIYRNSHNFVKCISIHVRS